MGFNPFKAAKDFVEDEVVNKIKYPIEDAFKDLGDYLVELGDDFGDWVRGDTPEIPGGTLTTTYADPSKLPVIYGTRKTGGRFIFEITADTVDVDPPNEHLRYVVLYCEAGDHGIHGFGEHYFNDIPVSSGEFDGFYTITEFTGAPGQRLPTSIINKLPGWVRGTHTLDGWAGAVYDLTWKGGEGKQPFSRKPNITAEVHGLKIKRFDQGAARFSRNPIEILWDYLRAERYGWGIPLDYLSPVRSAWETESLFAQNNKMTCNVRLDLNRSRKQLLDSIRQDFRINMPPRLGEVVPVIEKDMAVVRVFDEDTIPGPVQKRPIDITKRLNRVTIRWNDKIDNYKTREYTYPDQAVHESLVIKDGGRTLQKTITSHCLDNEAEARQLAYVVLNRSRNDSRLRLPFNSDDLDLEPADLIQVSYRDFNIRNGIYRIVSIDIKSMSLDLVEHNADDYPWQGYENQNPTGGVEIPDLSKRYANDVTNVDLGAIDHLPASPDDDLSTIAVTVTPPTDTNFSHAIGRYRKQGNTSWTNLNQQVNPSANFVVPFVANTRYEVQVASVSRYGRTSDWLDSSFVQLGNNQSPMPDIINLALQGGGVKFISDSPTLTWKTAIVQPQYFDHFQVRICQPADTVIAEYKTTSPFFTYDYGQNLADGAGREFTVRVRAVSRTGVLGKQSSLAISNAAPSVDTLQVTAGVINLDLAMGSVSEDVTGFAVYCSKTNGFIPNDVNQIHFGPDRMISIRRDGEGGLIKSDTQYYLRVIVYDAFGPGNSSAQFAIKTNKLEAADLSGLGPWATKVDPVDDQFISTTLAANAISSEKIKNLAVGKLTAGVLNVLFKIGSQGVIETDNNGFKVVMGAQDRGDPDGVYVLHTWDGTGTTFAVTAGGKLKAIDADISGKIRLGAGSTGYAYMDDRPTHLKDINVQESAALRSASASAFLDDFSDSEYVWENKGGASSPAERSIIQSDESTVGGNILRVGNNDGNDEIWDVHPTTIPYDPNKLYRMQARIRRVAGVGKIYLGVAGVKADGETLVSGSGAESYSSQHYIAASGENAVDDQWHVYTGYAKGLHDDPNSWSRPNPTTMENPAKLNPAVRYMRPLLLLGYSNETGVYEVDYVRVDVVNDYTSDVAGTPTTLAEVSQAEADKLTGIAAGAQVNGALATVIINENLDGSSGSGEACLVGFDDQGNVDKSKAGSIYVNGILTEIPIISRDATVNVSFHTQAMGKGYLVWETNGTRPLQVMNENAALVFAKKENGQWFYDKNSITWQPFTPSETMVVIGECVTGPNDFIVSASIYQQAKNLDSVAEAGATLGADWDSSISGRPANADLLNSEQQYNDVTGTPQTLADVSQTEAEKLASIAEGAQVNGALATVLINQSFSGGNTPGECCIVGFDDIGNVSPGKDGWIYINGVLKQIPRNARIGDNSNSVLTGAVGQGYFIWETNANKSFTVQGQLSRIVYAKFEGGNWFYDNNSSTWKNFTPSNTLFVIGECVTGPNDFIVSASIYQQAKSLDSVAEAGATVGANWDDNIQGRPANADLLNSEQQYNDVTGTPQTLADVNSTEGEKLLGVAVGATANASGQGVNFANPSFAVNPDPKFYYSAPETHRVVPNGLLEIDASNQGQPSGKPIYKLVCTGPNPDAFMYLSKNNNNFDYNTPINPNRKWLLSIYVKVSAPNTRLQFYLKTSNGRHNNAGYFYPSSTNWERVSFVMNLSENPSTACVFRVDCDQLDAHVLFDQFMIEPLTGTGDVPSEYVHPAANSLSQVNKTEADKLDGIADGATVGADWYENLQGRPADVEFLNSRQKFESILNIPDRITNQTTPGLNLTDEYLGFFDGARWRAFIRRDGAVKLGGIGNNLIEYNGSKLQIKTDNFQIDAQGNVGMIGSLQLLAGSSGYDQLADIPTGLADINSQEGGHLNSIETGATVGATWGDNVAGQPSNGQLFNNLLDISEWVVGTSGTRGNFIHNGSEDENYIDMGMGPYGTPEPRWRAGNDVGSDADGGWNYDFPCDNRKSYRLSVYAMQTGDNGSVYLGAGNQGRTLTMSGGVNNNPYFWSGDLPINGKWYLIVGVIHSYDSGTQSSEISGVYDPETGRRVKAGTDYKMAAGVTTQRHRAYHFYNTNPSQLVFFVRPRVDELNGNEPPLNSLPTRAALIAPNAKGLHVTQDYLGFYDGSSYQSYIDKAGNFKFGGATNNFIRWNGNNLVIKSNNLILDAAGNLAITGSIRAGGGRLVASQSTYVNQYTPNGTYKTILRVDSSNMGGVAGIVVRTNDTYGVYAYSSSGDAIRGISGRNDGVKGSAFVETAGGGRFTNTNGPQIYAGDNSGGSINELTQLRQFPQASAGAMFCTTYDIYYGTRWGVNSRCRWYGLIGRTYYESYSSIPHI